MKKFATICGWLVSIVLIFLGILWIYQNFNAAFSGPLPDSGLPLDESVADIVVQRETWFLPAALILLGLFLNPLLLGAVPGLRRYWVRALVGFGVAGIFVAIVVYNSMGRVTSDDISEFRELREALALQRSR